MCRDVDTNGLFGQVSLGVAAGFAAYASANATAAGGWHPNIAIWVANESIVNDITETVLAPRGSAIMLMRFACVRAEGHAHKGIKTDRKTVKPFSPGNCNASRQPIFRYLSGN